MSLFRNTKRPDPPPGEPDLMEQLLIYSAERTAKEEAHRWELGIVSVGEVRRMMGLQDADKRLDQRWANLTASRLHAPDGGRPEDVGCVGYGEI